MIIAGIFGSKKNQHHDVKKKLDTLVGLQSLSEIKTIDGDFYSVAMGSKYVQNQSQICLFQNEKHKKFVVGKVFDKNQYQSLQADELEKISSGQEFVDRYWGAYVYVSIDEDKQRIEILRDTLGSVSLFYTELAPGITVFASELRIITSLFESIAYNHDYIYSYLALGTVLTDQTPFERIYSLYPGCQLVLHAQKKYQELVFDPAKYTQEHSYSPQELHEEIVSRLKKILSSWTEGADGLVLDFSGGTDSSGLLFCLKELASENQEIKPINMYHDNVRSSDERVHARTIAQEVGVDLVELDMGTCLNFDEVEHLPKFPNYPSPSFTAMKAEDQMLKPANKYKNPSLISGHGGDHIFLCPPPIWSLTDYLVDHGSKGYMNKLQELAMMTRRPFMPLIKDTIKGFGMYKGVISYETLSGVHAKKPTWLSQENYDRGLNRSLHPLYQHKSFLSLPPGKMRLIDGVYSGFATIVDDVRANRGFPMFYPLFSQPMLELAFSIPTYKTYSQGFNRYPFRRAISDHFGTKNVWRKDKGETSGIFQKGLEKNAQQVSDLCTQGYCAQNGLIDAQLAKSHLYSVMGGNIDRQWSLTYLATIELFLKCWEK